MLILSISDQKESINSLILPGLQEILHKGLRVHDKSLGSLEDDIGIMMRALQIKNKIYDYAVIINPNPLMGIYEGRIIYSLINTEKMNNDASEYEEVIEFTF